MKVRDVFVRAAELLEEKGWTQGTYRDDVGCMCLIGACREALIEKREGKLSKSEATCIVENDNGPFYPLLQKATDDGYFPFKWNDVPGRTKDEVVGALKKAAELAGDADVS